MLFTIVLWAAYFRNLERNDEGWSVPSPPQIRARGSVVGVGGLQPGPALVLSRRWIKISIGICVSIFCTQVVQHVAYEEYTQRKVAHLMHTERSYYHDHPFWRPNNFDLANPAKHHSAWETAFFYLVFGDRFLDAMQNLLFLLGVDAVCLRFLRLCYTLEYAASNTIRKLRYLDAAEAEEFWNWKRLLGPASLARGRNHPIGGDFCAIIDNQRNYRGHR